MTTHECPRCGNNFTESKAEKTEDGDTVRCPSCNRRQDGLGRLEDRFAV